METAELLEETVQEKSETLLNSTSSSPQPTAEAWPSNQEDSSKSITQKALEMESRTVFFEFHLHSARFNKSIPAEEFIRKIKEEDEEILTDEQRQQIEAYRQASENKTDAKLIHVSQKILKCKELKDIDKLDTGFRSWLRAYTIPCPVRFQGAFLVSLKRVEQIEAQVKEFLAERIVRIRKFKEVYFQKKEEAKTARGPFYCESDYPDWEEIEKEFWVEFNWINFDAPAKLKQVNEEVYRQAQERAELKWVNAVEEATKAQRILFEQCLINFTEMLGTDESGKRKTFKPKAVEKLKQFYSLFPEMNLPGDEALAEVVKKTEQLVQGFSVEDLRKDKTLRDVALKAAEKIKEVAQDFITVRERKVVFEDADEVLS